MRARNLFSTRNSSHSPFWDRSPAQGPVFDIISPDDAPQVQRWLDLSPQTYRSNPNDFAHGAVYILNYRAVSAIEFYVEIGDCARLDLLLSLQYEQVTIAEMSFIQAFHRAAELGQAHMLHSMNSFRIMCGIPSDDKMLDDSIYFQAAPAALNVLFDLKPLTVAHKRHLIQARNFLMVTRAMQAEDLAHLNEFLTDIASDNELLRAFILENGRVGHRLDVAIKASSPQSLKMMVNFVLTHFPGQLHKSDIQRLLPALKETPLLSVFEEILRLFAMYMPVVAPFLTARNNKVFRNAWELPLPHFCLLMTFVTEHAPAITDNWLRTDNFAHVRALAYLVDIDRLKALRTLASTPTLIREALTANKSELFKTASQLCLEFDDEHSEMRRTFLMELLTYTQEQGFLGQVQADCSDDVNWNIFMRENGFVEASQLQLAHR